MIKALFSRKPRPGPSEDAELAALRDLVKELVGRVQHLEDERAELEAEWTGWHEKFSTLHARLAKRAQRDGAAEAQQAPPAPMSIGAQRLLNLGAR